MSFLGLDVSNWINIGILLVAGIAASVAVSQARAATRSAKEAREGAAASWRQVEAAQEQLTLQLQEIAKQAEENAHPFAPRFSVRVEPIEQAESVGAAVYLYNLGQAALEILQVSLDGIRVDFEAFGLGDGLPKSASVIAPNDRLIILLSMRSRKAFLKRRSPSFSAASAEVTLRHVLDELASYAIRFDITSENEVYLKVGVPMMVRSLYEDW